MTTEIKNNQLLKKELAEAKSELKIKDAALKQLIHSIEHEGEIHGRIAQAIEHAKKVTA